MNLLVDMHCFDKNNVEGVNTYLFGLYSELLICKTNIKFYFISHDIENLKTKFGTHDNLVYVKLNSTNKLIRLFIEIPFIIYKYNIDASHYQYISPIIKNSFQIVTLHDILFVDYPEYFPFMYRVKNYFLFRLSAKRADLLLTVSDYSKNAIAKHFSINEGEIFVTKNGVKSVRCSVSNLNYIANCYSKKQYILNVSRFEPRKNHKLLLKAFVELNLYDRFNLVFVGKKSIEVSDFDQYYVSLSENIKKSVIFLSNLSNEELRDVYRNSYLVVYPSIAEGFGIPPLEAALNKRVCLCSNSTAMSDFKFFKKSSFDPLSIEELKCLLQSMINNRSSINVEEIYVNVINDYDLKKIANDYLLILNKVYGEHI